MIGHRMGHVVGWRGRVAGSMLGATLGALVLACSSSSHAPRLAIDQDADLPIDVGPETTSAFDVGADATPLSCGQSEEAGILCACTEIAQDPPTLYLVLDVSGSMAESIDGSTTTKWDLVRYALLDVTDGALRKVGARVAVGASIFPGTGGGCNTGKEIFPITIGGTATYDDLANRLHTILPDGATPTAVSLGAAEKRLETRKGAVYVLLATDGAPNCGTSTCSADRCTYDIEGAKLSDGTTCAAPLNCCDPASVSGGMGWQACVDATATQSQVTALAAKGIDTFVVGVPGTELYASDLDALAVAGGQPADAETGGHRYYDAKDRASLLAALKTIAAKIAATCTLTLDAPVSDPGVTNVLLDGVVVPMDATNGWTWTDDSHIELHGSSCDSVLGGDVGRVQVAVGCKTVTAR